MKETTEERRVDRRILKTRKAIREAFFKLASEQDYRKISISALAREANIDRKTFYLHYKSVDALVSELVDEFITALASDIHLFLVTPTKDREEAMELADEIFSRTRTNLGSLKTVRDNVPPGHFMTLFESPLWHMLRKLDWSDIFGANPDPAHSSLMISFIIGGIVSSFRYWHADESNIEFPIFACEIRDLILNNCKELNR